ncbi:MAG: ABC transporter permease [Armatimonadetes bacterium]|nr:ABC transporter permease [Armatimonadota bacterium]
MAQRGDILEKTAQELVQVAALPTRYASQQLMEFLETLGEAVYLLIHSFRCMFSRSHVWVDAVTQMGILGVNSLALVMITVAFSGMVLSLYSSQLLVKWGVGSFVGGGLALSIVREIAPVLTAVVVAARAGSAISSEIGTMKVTEQIDALRSLSIDPVEFLVTPRVIASVAVFPMLTVFANWTGMLGGYLVAVLQGVAGGAFKESVQRMLMGYDISMGLVKAAIFGLVVALVCCQQGLRTHGGATGVGRSTTNAVVISIVAIYILNFFLAYIMFGRSMG